MKRRRKSLSGNSEFLKVAIIVLLALLFRKSNKTIAPRNKSKKFFFRDIISKAIHILFKNTVYKKIFNKIKKKIRNYKRTR